MHSYKEKVVIINKLGLHARPASRFAQLASGFEAEVFLVKNGEEVNGKSILEILTLASPAGTELSIRAEGPDAEQAVTKLKELIDNRFGEPE
jgi:phosphocarrier protein